MTTLTYRHELAHARARAAYVPAPKSVAQDHRSGIPDPQQLAKMIEQAKAGPVKKKVAPTPHPKSRPKTLKRKLRELMADGRWRCVSDVQRRIETAYCDEVVRQMLKEMTADGILILERSGPSSTLCFRLADFRGMAQ